MRKWLVTKFVDLHRDEYGHYKVGLDGRKAAGSVGLSKDMSEEDILHALADKGLDVNSGDWIDWISGVHFNVNRGERPLYSVSTAARYSWDPTVRRTHAAKYGHVRPGSRKMRRG